LSNLQLSAALSPSPMTRPLLDGAVSVEGVDLTSTAVHGSEMFWRQLRFEEFDVSEFSLSSLLIALTRGDRRWTAIPVFTTRRFFHTGIFVNAAAGIREPADLKGKRVGVPEYQQTAALWSRAALQHEFGVAPQDVVWYMERPVERSHGGATGFQPPPGVELHYIPTDTNIGEMLVAGELDATLLYLGAPNLVDRSSIDITASEAVRPLFPDPLAEGIRYYKKTGVLPVNHTVVVRTSILEQHPWVALNLYGAFVRAKEHTRQKLGELLKPYETIGTVGHGQVGPLGVDPLPYGVTGQQEVLELLAQYSHEQGLTTRRVDLSEVFFPATLDL
jgi:4,5-dihydroxyphthalate decarboxylase